MIPTSTSNSSAIGYRKRLIKTAGGPIENAQKTSVESKPLFELVALAGIIET
jgi:hypothetical protein